MVTKIVGVHGVWNYRSGSAHETAARSISETWAADLSHIVPSSAFELQVAYYAPYLRKAIPQGGGSDGLDQLPREIEDMILAWARELGALPSTVAQGPMTMPVRVLVDRVATVCQLRPSLASGLRTFVGLFFREVAAYLHSPDNPGRLAARECVAQLIASQAADILISHSLGTVVAYEALLAHPELTIDLFVTLGSPLGMPVVVYERLQPRQPAHHGIHPANVGRWVNIADPGDIIAIPRPFTTRFAPNENYERDYIHIMDFHSVRHYLTSPRMAAVASDYFERKRSV